MKAFIFKNTNKSTAWLSVKALINYAKCGNNFVVVFDKEYDILNEVPELYQRVYFLHTANVFKTIKDCELVILDFDLDMLVNNCASYQEYIELKISSLTSPLQLYLEENNHLDDIISQCNKHQFTDVLLSIKDPQCFNICKNYLDGLVNVITYDNASIIEMYYLINKCSFVVSDNQLEYLISKELNKPKFTIVNNLEVTVKKSNNTFVFDPFKNETHVLPPREFRNDREITKKVNSQIIDYNSVKDLLIDELKDALDKYKVPYVTYLPS